MGRQSTENIEWRRSQVIAYHGDGYSIRDIATKLIMSKTQIHRDLVYLTKHAHERIDKFVNEDIPMEYASTLASVKGIIKDMSDIIDNAKRNKDGTPKEEPDVKRIMEASSIKMQAQGLKMELITGANLAHESIDLSNRYRGLIAKKDKLLKDGNSIPA